MGTFLISASHASRWTERHQEMRNVPISSPIIVGQYHEGFQHYGGKFPVTHNNERRAFVAGLIGLGLAGCGGGGGGGSSGTPPPSSGGGGSTPPPSPAIPFTNVSVHDPSVIRAGGNYYVFGSHLA